jgi:predicted GNAT superfamily acetyltransferase
MADIIIRDCNGIPEFDACVEIQKQVWGYDPSDIIPSRMFVVARKIGGQIIGAFDGDRLVGFALGFPGVRNVRAYMHSHMLAVLPEYRNEGLGRRLKLAQRDDALERGFELMEWTFDPLEIKNAHLNINKLGAIIRRYVPNQYGEISSTLQAGLPSDRLIAEWWIKSRRVEQLLDIGTFPVYEIRHTVSVPAEIAKWKQTGDTRARETQTRLRQELGGLLAQGLAVLQYRVREDGAGEYGLGVWDEDWNYGLAPQEHSLQRELNHQGA